MTYEEILGATLQKKKEMLSDLQTCKRLGNVAFTIAYNDFRNTGSSVLAKYYLDLITENFTALVAEFSVDASACDYGEPFSEIYSLYTKYYNGEEIEVGELPEEARF